MAPHPPPLYRALLATALSLVTLAGLLSAGACATGTSRDGTVAAPKVSAPPGSAPTSWSAPGSEPPTGSSPAAPSATSTSAGPSTATASPGPSGPTLADYLARIPTFPAPPVPEVVTLHHPPGQAAWASRIPTTQQVAFLTIDDGIVASTDAVALMRAARVPVTLFLTTNTISPNKEYFAQLVEFGAVIESHTVSHPQLPSLGYGGQHYELCRATDLLEQWYGRRPLFFRPPYGEWNETTLRAAYDCGLRAGFGWAETVNNGVVRFQTARHVIQPGDIVLMHFRSTFAADFVAALRAIKAAGLVPVLLEDYVHVIDRPPIPNSFPGAVTSAIA